VKREKNFEIETPKIEPLPGFIETRYIKCGRSNCHCSTSKGHGPYHYWIYKNGNQRFKKYVKKEDLPVISARIEARRKRTIEIIKFNREARLRWKLWKARLGEFKELFGV
jgi:hypothetical protein